MFRSSDDLCCAAIRHASQSSHRSALWWRRTVQRQAIMTETTNKSGSTKRVERDVPTMAQAEAIAAQWRTEGFRVGTSYQGDNGLYRVDGLRKSAK
jgi:hypothetical protein